MEYNSLIPELTVKDINVTKKFYLELLGFKLEYERKEDNFIFVAFEGSQMMFEQWREDGWNIAPLEYPYGRGINFSIIAANIDSLYQRLIANDHPVYRPLMVNSYEVDGTLIVQKEFLVQDPDGYLLRFTD